MGDSLMSEKRFRVLCLFLRFYSDPALRPDFGNVPLLRKALGGLAAAKRNEGSRG
jgi:hypothetical protein